MLPTYTFEQVQKYLNRPERELHLLMMLLTHSSAKSECIHVSQLLPILVYDILKTMGFSDEDCNAMLMAHRDALLIYGEQLHNALTKHTPVIYSTFGVVDNKYAMMTPSKTAFDFKACEEKALTESPIVALSIALPRLYELARRSLGEPLCQRS